jgi:hypothetical protein
LVSAGAAQAREASEAPLLRGICDPGLIESWRSRGPATVKELSTRLGADVVRVNLRWSEAEERRGVYEEDYLGRALRAVQEIRARGMQAVVLVYQPPRWASDRRFWSSPVSGDRAGVYQSYYPPSLDSLEAFREFARHLAVKMQGEVLAYSCWVEPNLWVYLYPQRTASDPGFAAHRYARMLAAFSQGVRAGDPSALVVAGETSPTGDNTRYRTSPLRFARLLRDAGAADHFDAYAHHPYPVAGNKDISPAAIPRDPSRTVWLGNLGTLLEVFPGKPFYLSEFGYSTAHSSVFGVSVSQARQASYLTASYQVAARYPQVRMLTWFPIRDYSESGSYSDRFGVYCGLRDLRGLRKRAYYAYAGGNQLTLRATDAVRRGAALILRGRLTSERMGPLGAKGLDVMARLPGRSWVVVAHVSTRSDGTYAVRLRPQRSATWRVRWAGVVTSPTDWVPVTLP